MEDLKMWFTSEENGGWNETEDQFGPCPNSAPHKDENPPKSDIRDVEFGKEFEEFFGDDFFSGIVHVCDVVHQTALNWIEWLENRVWVDNVFEIVVWLQQRVLD